MSVKTIAVSSNYFYDDDDIAVTVRITVMASGVTGRGRLS
jgi:hypothetical protein